MDAVIVASVAGVTAAGGSPAGADSRESWSPKRSSCQTAAENRTATSNKIMRPFDRASPFGTVCRTGFP